MRYAQATIHDTTRLLLQGQTKFVAFKALQGVIEGAGASGSSLHAEILKVIKDSVSVCSMIVGELSGINCV